MRAPKKSMQKTIVVILFLLSVAFAAFVAYYAANMESDVVQAPPPHSQRATTNTSEKVAGSAVPPDSSAPTKPAAKQPLESAPEQQDRATTTQNIASGPLPDDGLPARAVVCLDPGHPSETGRGTTASNGLTEMELCFDVAMRARLLLIRHGVQVVLTKESADQYVTNRMRAETANRAGADLFIRLHADGGNGSGFTIYYPRQQGVVNGVRGPSEVVLAASKKAAEVFHAAFSSRMAVHLPDNGIRGDEATRVGSQQGALTGSIYSQVPVLLIEIGFLTNEQDAAWLSIAENRQTVAESIVDGALAWLSVNRK
jgi:N-acetylmuramoyl-L-alanine amidase